jgi:hypothetical protein
MLAVVADLVVTYPDIPGMAELSGLLAEINEIIKSTEDDASPGP